MIQNARLMRAHLPPRLRILHMPRMASKINPRIILHHLPYCIASHRSPSYPNIEWFVKSNYLCLPSDTVRSVGAGLRPARLQYRSMWHRLQPVSSFNLRLPYPPLHLPHICAKIAPPIFSGGSHAPRPEIHAQRPSALRSFSNRSLVRRSPFRSPRLLALP